jgi:hypothetical protein
MGVDITSTLHLDIAAGGSFAHKTPKERKEFLDYISGKFSFLTNPSKPHQESMSIHKRPSVAESEPSSPHPNQEHRRKKKLNLQSSLFNSRMIHLETMETP